MSAVISPVIALLLFVVLVLEMKKKGRQFIAAFCGAGLIVCFPGAAEMMRNLLVWGGTEGARLMGNMLGTVFNSIG